MVLLLSQSCYEHHQTGRCHGCPEGDHEASETGSVSVGCGIHGALQWTHGGWMRNPNHLLKAVVNIPWILGFQPSFWWSRISQTSTVRLAQTFTKHVPNDFEIDHINDLWLLVGASIAFFEWLQRFVTNYWGVQCHVICMGIFLGVISHLMGVTVPLFPKNCPSSEVSKQLQVVIEVNPVLCGFAVLRDYEGCMTCS